MQIGRRAAGWAIRTWLVLVALGLATLAALSAKAGRQAMSAHPYLFGAERTRAAGYEADDHFPGAALLLARLHSTGQTHLLRGNTTGTAVLPSLPVPSAVTDDLVRTEPAGVSAAQPFSFKEARAIDRGRALECLTAAIYYEAGGESDDGQQAVAQVIINRTRHPAFPATVCGVVYQGSDKLPCQFSFACDGAMARRPSAAGWTRASRTAAAALAGRVYAPVGLATHYHSFAVTPAWNRELVMTDMVGAHLFHRWRGYWGAAAAFRRRYAGGEPAPGPHLPSGMLPIVAAATAPVPPAIRDRPEPASPSSSDRLPPAATVLARWRDAGSQR